MSHIEIPILVSETKRNGILYRSCKETALKILSLLDQITSSPEHQSLDTSASSADEIMKFKKLLDDGIITAEEFEAKSASFSAYKPLSTSSSTRSKAD